MSKYNEVTVAKILEILEAGQADKAAYTSVRLSKSQFYEWQNLHPEFKEAVAAAKANAHIAVTSKLTEQIKKGNIAAIIFWLKTRHPEEWRDKTEVVHSGSIGTYEERIQRLRGKRQKEDDGTGSDSAD